MTNHLRILSWNALADACAVPKLFPLTSRQLLRPGARDAAILKMAVSFSAHIIALQEVERGLAQRFASALRGWDVRWCPKAYGTPDGCLTAVHPDYPVTAEQRLVYADGRVAHIVTAGDLVVANTHLKWRPRGTPLHEHAGVAECRELLAALANTKPVVIAGDTNDPLGGPVRQVLAIAGFTEVQAIGPTNLVRGTETAELDIIAVRSLRGTPVPTGLRAEPPLPGPLCPSDHLPIVADLILGD